MAMLRQGQLLQHSIRRDLRFRVLGRLGEGGFGEADEVVGLSENDQEFDNTACLKVTTDAWSWHGETYFMRLLEGDLHAVQLYDSFPVRVGEGDAARTRFCLLMELLKSRSVSDLCDSGELPWPEDRVVRQLRYLLRTLGRLHELQTPHRDITPTNTYVGNNSALKLGDYGIAATAKLRKGVRANAFNPAFCPPDLKTFWDRRDDLYQVGLLALTLLSGEVHYAGVKKPAVNALARKDGALREAIKTALSVKSQRHEHAGAMRAALEG